MTEDYYKPNEIRYSRQQIEWLIPLLPLLRSGSYPRDPTESGYTQAPGKRQVKAKASFIMAAEIASELDWRIQQAGWEGLITEMVYSNLDDRYWAMQHIAESLEMDINEVERVTSRVIRYLAGFKRRQRTYSQWRNHRGGKG